MEKIINTKQNELSRAVRWWQPVLFTALAGGLGWGIRGQYGHETGAMIAGLLVSMTAVFLVCPTISLDKTVRAIAWGTVAMGFGGSMTYGQTIGLTCDSPLLGNWEAWRWGMLGLSIKGGIWIGFAGVFLGMGLGAIHYRSRELLLLMLVLLLAYLLGVHLLNKPFDPDHKILPVIYFSDHWHWKPDAILKPRPECWGGLLLALLTTILYTGSLRKDRLAPRLALWGVLGGVIGFPLGQCLQSYHAWNPDVFKHGVWLQLDPFMNWWNMMETTFGATMGGLLGFGCWLNRKLICQNSESNVVAMPSLMEWFLLLVHLTLLITAEFMSIPVLHSIYSLGLIMGIVPIVACAAGRWWPYLIIFPVTLVPIAGKTFNQIVFHETALSPMRGGILYLLIPLLISTAAAVWFANSATVNQSGRSFIRYALLINTWIYFLLNYAFFHFPWPWTAWTTRTPNGLIFSVCAIGLTWMALRGKRYEKVD